MSSGIIRPSKKFPFPDKDWRRFCVKKGGGGGGGVGTPVDLLCRFESGTSGNALTVADLNAATLATSAAAGTWTIPVVAPTIHTGGEMLVEDFNFNSITQPDGGSRGLQMNVAQDQIFARYTLTTSAPVVSIGFAWIVETTGSSFNFYNWGELTSTSGQYAAFHHRDFSPQQIGIEDSLSNIGGLITISGSTFYWVTMLFDKNTDTIRLRLYELGSFTQVGTESTLTSAGLVNNCNRIMIGRTDNHDVFGAENCYIDDLAVCLSTGVGATFPLLPT